LFLSHRPVGSAGLLHVRACGADDGDPAADGLPAAAEGEPAAAAEGEPAAAAAEGEPAAAAEGEPAAAAAEGDDTGLGPLETHPTMTMIITRVRGGAAIKNGVRRQKGFRP
jgi:hypothetical protein